MIMEQLKSNYLSPCMTIHCLSFEEVCLDSRDNGEMGNGGFLDE